MGFADTFREERLMSRRSRARKARILGRGLAFALMLAGAALVRLDPQVRRAADAVMMALVGAAMGVGEPAEARAAGGDAGADIDAAEAPPPGSMPPSAVRINRGTGG